MEMCRGYWLKICFVVVHIVVVDAVVVVDSGDVLWLLTMEM